MLDAMAGTDKATNLPRFAVWVGATFIGALKMEKKVSSLLWDRYSYGEVMDRVGAWAEEMYEEKNNPDPLDFWTDDQLLYEVCNRLRELVGLKRKVY